MTGNMILSLVDPCIVMEPQSETVVTKSEFYSTINGTSLKNYSNKDDTTNFRQLTLRSTHNSIGTTEKAIGLYESIDGVGATYDVYTTANLIFSLSGTTLNITTKF